MRTRRPLLELCGLAVDLGAEVGGITVFFSLPILRTVPFDEGVFIFFFDAMSGPNVKKTEINLKACVTLT